MGGKQNFPRRDVLVVAGSLYASGPFVAAAVFMIGHKLGSLPALWAAAGADAVEPLG